MGMSKKTQPVTISPLESIYHVWGWILLVWSLYRYFIKLPEWADEFIFKPLVFVAPVLWYVLRKEKRTLQTIGLTTKNLFNSLAVGLVFGMAFAVEGLVVHYIKYGTISVNPIAAFGNYGFFLIVISLATAFSEEILCRGFLFNRINEKTKNILYAAFIASVLFVLLHVPMLVTTTKLQGMTLVLFFVTDFTLAFANSMLFAVTGSLVAPILVHVFWNMTVALFL
jgi:membrane protease YdiL (CAAX protease family)